MLYLMVIIQRNSSDFLVTTNFWDNHHEFAQFGPGISVLLCEGCLIEEEKKWTHDFEVLGKTFTSSQPKVKSVHVTPASLNKLVKLWFHSVIHNLAVNSNLGD